MKIKQTNKHFFWKKEMFLAGLIHVIEKNEIPFIDFGASDNSSNCCNYYFV